LGHRSETAPNSGYNRVGIGIYFYLKTKEDPSFKAGFLKVTRVLQDF
jgi:hypothetical protein